MLQQLRQFLKIPLPTHRCTSHPPEPNTQSIKLSDAAAAETSVPTTAAAATSAEVLLQLMLLLLLLQLVLQPLLQVP